MAHIMNVILKCKSLKWFVLLLAIFQTSSLLTFNLNEYRYILGDFVEFGSKSLVVEAKSCSVC